MKLRSRNPESFSSDYTPRVRLTMLSIYREVLVRAQLNRAGQGSKSERARLGVRGIEEGAVWLGVKVGVFLRGAAVEAVVGEFSELAVGRGDTPVVGPSSKLACELLIHGPNFGQGEIQQRLS